MKQKIISLILILCIFMVCGCTEKKTDADTTTVFVHKDGSITDAIVEEFTAGYYDATELQTMTNKELTAYNQSTGDMKSAVLSQYQVTDGMAKVFIDFKTIQDYAAFNETDGYFGTIADAYEAGYDLDVTLKNIADDKTADKNALLEMGKNKILILEEHVDVITYKKILYKSANVDIINDTHARISDEAEGFAYIVLK
ncbi:MAG: hypothetical protein Q4G60_02760 [bacterium]|nr:hypothetical protein [bacterium]